MCLSSVWLWQGSAAKRGCASGGDRAIAWQLVQRCLSCGNIAGAEDICFRGNSVDTVTWTAVITANAETGHLQRAVQLLDTMASCGAVPDSVTFVTLLGSCARRHALDEGRLVHERLKAAPIRHELKVANAVLNMYAKCRAVSEAAQCFSSLPAPDVVSWTIMVGLYAGDGSSRSIETFNKMQQAGLRPNHVSFISVLRGCEQLSRGRMVHSLLGEAGLLEDVPTMNALLGMYSRCRSLDDAIVTFELMQYKDVVTWTTMVAAQLQLGRQRAALWVYHCMLLDGCSRPSSLTLSAALAACSCDLESGRKLHEQALEAVGDGDSDVAVSLVSMYGRCKRPREARQAFERVAMRNRGRMLWNAMVTAHSDVGEHEQALKVFREMQLECGGGNSDRITIVAALNACASLGNWKFGRTIYEACAGRELAQDVVVATTAVNMYSRCGKLSGARTVFDGIVTSNRDVVAWNAMVAAYAAAQQGREAVALSRAMHCEGVRHSKPTLVSLLSSGCELREGLLAHNLAVEAGMLDNDVVLATALLNMYASCGELERAAAVFEAAAAKGSCSGDVVLWTSLVVAYQQAGKHEQALSVYTAMPMFPDSVAAAAALLAAGGLAALSAGRGIHSKLPVAMMTDIRVGNALVAMYGKCGSPADATKVFGAMTSRDATSWGCLVAAFAAKGQSKAAVKALRMMKQEGWVPGEATIVVTLAACSHDGMLEEGCHLFGAVAATATTIEMCGCVVDMLCRAGHLDKADDLIRSSRLSSPKTVLWSTLLAACNVHGDVERGRRAAEELKRIDPKNDAPYVVVSSMVAMHGSPHCRGATWS